MTEVMMCCVVYQGRKLFWRTRHSIDVTIVQHCEFDVTEVIAYEPSINVEAKRIYLNSKVVFQKLNKLDAGSKRNEVSGSTEFSNNVTNQAISEFILSRLIVSKFNRADGCFEVALELKRCDGVSWSNGAEAEELVCAKVDELQPYETKHHKLLTHGEVDAALKALGMEQHQLSVSCSEAAAFQAEANAMLLEKEHWWNPIIDTGKAFNAVDTPGSELITSNRKAVTLAKPIVDSSKANLQLNTTINGGAGARGESLSDSAGRARADLSAPKLYDASSREKHELSGSRNSSPMGNKIGEPLGRNSITPCNSSRLFAGTAASQARAQCAAEDNQPTPKVSRKKILKRANSSRSVLNTSNSTSKRSLRVATRSESRDIADFAADPSADPWASPEADYSTLGDGAIGGSARVGFVTQVATGLSSFAASVSAKFKTPSGHNRVSDDVNDDIPNQPMIEQGLAESAVPTVAVSRLNSAELMGEDDAPPEMGIKKQRSKGKRSSYFGAVLEKLIGADSEPESQVFTAKAPSQKLLVPNRSLSIKANRKTSWLPWNLFGTATVVPIE